MISVVHGSPQTVWVPVAVGATVYVGSIVTLDLSAIATSEGLVVREQADGAANTTNKDRPYGVVVGTNRKEPLFSSTYNAEYITDEGAAGPATSTVEYVGVEGAWSKGEKRAMIHVALITPNTVLRAPFYNNAVGTAPALLTVSVATSNVAVTTNACDVAGVAGLGSIHFRTGPNAGTYRITDDSSDVDATWDIQLPASPTVGDKAVRVGVRTAGTSYVRLGDDTVCSYINTSETAATNYDIIHVVRLDLSVAGREYCEFMFDGDHFATIRA